MSICFEQNIAVIMLANTKIHWVVPFFSVTTSERSQSSRSIRYSGLGVDSVGPTVGDFLETAEHQNSLRLHHDRLFEPSSGELSFGIGN